jgi:hypothetical protein
LKLLSKKEGGMKSKIFILMTALMVILSLEITAGDFTDNGDGTVTDNITGLMWQQEDDDVTRNWEDSITYCEGFSLAGHADWRLPNHKEHSSIVDISVFNPAIDGIYFPNTNSSGYWLSTTDVDYPDYAWYVNFYNGYVFSRSKSINYYVRCVRGGQ